MSMTTSHKPGASDELMRLHDRRVALIRQAANEARDADYQARWGDVLARCADWFSSLPYSPMLYREPGGAFRCTVETAFYAMRLAGGQKFGTNLPSEQRRRIEPQYNHAVFLAAVCSGLDEPYRHFTVVRESDRTEWNPAGHGALGPWLAGSAYALHRRAQALPVERMRTALLAQNLIGHSLLVGYEASVLAELFGAINPIDRPHANESLVHKVLRQAVAVAADFDRKAQQGVYEPVQYPVPAAIHVAAAVQPVVTPAPSPASTPAAAAAAAAGAAASGTAAMPPAGAPPTDAQAAPTVTVPTAPSSTASVPNATAAATPVAPTQSPAPASPGPTGATSADSSPKHAVSTKPDQQMGLPFAGETPAPVAVDPSAMRAPAARADASAQPPNFDQVLDGMPNMIREFFRALREDVAAGTAKVAWTDKGLAIPKRLVGSFGVASDTLVEHLRRRGLLVSNVQAEVVLAVRAGELILERKA
ncbi:TraI domain-containing protein [Paraburkholderia tropica]|uniref:TraI domain-containing protein n=1 Tax=Paraburkholderia tropica TaxID=92647 RepID=UPI002AB6B54C|nr:TraI domain-containing protein [Paraburkholderia tropica]